MRAAALQRRLGLTDDELLAVLDEDALTVITDDLDHRPEVPLLLQLTAGPSERLGEERFVRWVRANGAKGRPLDHLLARDFTAFEDALDDLDERGFIIRKRR
jgi:hypothetical protein